MLLIPKPDIPDVDDDLQREVAFYNQALSAVQESHKMFKELNFPYRRPTDYFAEMVKSDEHMANVRRNLLNKQKKISESEARRKQRDLKKYGKQVQVQKIQEREKKKKENLEAIKKWRKERERNKKSALDGDDDLPIEFDDEENKKKKNTNQKRNFETKNSKNSTTSKKRDFKNQKFGFGGKKSGKKKNDRASFASDSNPKKRGVKRKANKFSKKRPGKVQRKKQKRN